MLDVGIKKNSPPCPLSLKEREGVLRKPET
jgi:hypothetical protein